VEDWELFQGGCSQLVKFYEECGMTVFHKPIVDLANPTIEDQHHNINELTISLQKGESCLVHCWGGSGRTGCILAGAMRNFGIDNPIPYIRKVKSVYIEAASQEQFVNSMYTVLTERMAKECPSLTVGIVFDQVRDLCVVVGGDAGKGVSVASGGFQVTENTKYSDKDKAVLKTLFELIDIYADGTVVVNEFLEFFTKHLSDGVIADGVDADTMLKGFAVLNYCSYEQAGGVSRYTKKFNDTEETFDALDFNLFLRLMNSEVKINDD